MEDGHCTSTCAVLGVDVGGTNTRFHLINRGGARSWNEAGGNIALDAQSVRQTLLQAVRVHRPAALVAGVAGARTAELATHQLIADLKSAVRYVDVCSDGELALRAAFGTSDGIVISAGTGSVVTVRTGTGMATLGGHGYLLGDEGSAYDMGRYLLRRALRERDAGSTGLAEELEERLEEPLSERVRRIYADPTDRRLVAGLALAAELEHPAGGDAIQRAILAIGGLIDSARERFGSLPVCLVGGIFQLAPITSAIAADRGAVRLAEALEVAAARQAEAALR